ncbi:tetratricopeptide repeat protein [Xanthomonas arboricola]|uniref:tetratricopeptide repeat protein n=1 Tax=Xanthomonas arboricola TaxID=56448 RepID=UPI0016184377|nr:tetratricopeptide repeat protein [Xanthomonas arboricola]CAD7377089.1 tetratricopeptide repeat protein [Xanthomonas arboricola]CAG2084760.1 tetratricopeptide repeat protein [Xanthomonas arboricola pv. juglandis]
MSHAISRFVCHPLVLCLALGMLAGCASQRQYQSGDQAFGKGQYVEALEYYRAASSAAPDNIRYRQQYLRRRGEAMVALTTQADGYLAAGDLAKAEGAYQQALQIDPNNTYLRDRQRALNMRRQHDTQVSRIDELIAAGKLAEAERLVSLVLAEDPRNARALNSRERINAANFQHKVDDGIEGRFRKPVTLEFKDVPAKVIFEVLAKASGMNFVYDPEVRPDLKASVSLRDTPLDEAIRMICLSTQLETRVLNANSILIYPSTPQKISDYRPLSIRSFFLSNGNAKTVAESLKAILKTESIVVDEKLNMLIIRDSAEAIALAEKLVALHDIGDPEVMLDVEILEVKRTAVVDAGLNLPKEIGLSVKGADQSADWMNVDQLRALNSGSVLANIPNGGLKIGEDRSNAKILANPKIRVQSRQKAKVLIGDKVPVITSTSTSTGFVSETVNYVDVGLKLEVEPSVYASDDVGIKVNLEVSNLVREIISQSGTLSYQIGTRNAETTLRLRDGETQILAGLINKEDRKTASGLPWLSRFPVLDRLFGNKKSDKQDTEIVLSITPHLIRGIGPSAIGQLQFESGTATRLGGTADMRTSESAPATSGEKGSVAPPAPVIAPVVTPVPDTTPAQPEPVAEASAAMGWQVPAEVRTGEQFTAVLNLSSSQPIDQVPLLLGFDPQVLQVVSVEEGGFMNQGGGQSSLSKEVNLSDGRIVATLVRQGSAIAGQGALLRVNFKAMAPSARTELQILSAQVHPAHAQVRAANAVMSVK